MAVSASKLREDIYRILDQVLATGVAVEIERKGRRLRIEVADTARGRMVDLDALPERDYIVGDPLALAEIDWSAAWEPDAGSETRAGSEWPAGTLVAEPLPPDSRGR